MVSSPVRVNSKLKEAPKSKMSIFSYDKKSTGAEDYGKFVNTVLDNEYLYDLDILDVKREKFLKEYFVTGKKRELIIEEKHHNIGAKFTGKHLNSESHLFENSQKILLR